MKFIGNVEIVENKNICDNIYDMKIKSPDIVKYAKAGQFINLYTNNNKNILPRPISICEIDYKKSIIRLIYQVIGEGTEFFSKLDNTKDNIKVMGPLGNGYKILNAQKNVLIGGGIGIPPLLQLAKEIKGEKYVFLGVKKTPILVEEFKNTGATVYIATDNGSEGFKGNVIELVKNINTKTDTIYACGPNIMLKAVSDLAKNLNINAQLSLEEKMACGIGACVGCAIKIKKSEKLDWTNLKVCKDGPVFFSNEVIW